MTDSTQKLEHEHVHFSSKIPIPVKEHHLRYAMHQMNMLSGKTEYPPTLVNLQDDVSILRQHFIPTHAFENAVILRGTFLPLRTTYGNKRGALLMWKKKNVSQMYVLDTHSLDIRHLKPNQWTCVFLWNSNGNMPANPEVPHQQQPIEPPPGLPPMDNQPPVDPYGDVPMDPDINMPGPPLVPDDDHPDEPDNHHRMIQCLLRIHLIFHQTTHRHLALILVHNHQIYLHLLHIHHILVHIHLDLHIKVRQFHQHHFHTNLHHLLHHQLLHFHSNLYQLMLLSPTLVVPPTVADTPMHQSIKREQSVPASSPPKKAKAPAPGNQMIAPSGSSSHNHLGGDVPVSTSSQSSVPKRTNLTLNPKMKMKLTPQAGPSSGTPILPIDDDDAVNSTSSQ